MKASFSFCGVDIAKLGLQYAPELADTYVYKPGEASVNEETFDGHDGGYFYGVSRKPKEFILRCFFEGQQIDQGVMARIFNLFKVGRSGKLIFTRRPWCYYYATVTAPVDVSELVNYENGLIKITMKAYYPYARSDFFTNTRKEKFHKEIATNTAMYDEEGMEPDLVFQNVIAGGKLVLGNPGTEVAPLGIMLAGDVGMGVVITNQTNGTSCKFVAVTKAVTTNQARYVYIDAISGKTMLTGASDGQGTMAFLYHDQGFVTLEPNYPAIRDVYAADDGGVITLRKPIYEDVTGQYIWFKNKWRKITEQPNNDKTLVVDSAHTWSDPTVGGPYTRTTIMPMNELTVAPVSTMNLSHLEFIFKPTFT